MASRFVKGDNVVERKVRNGRILVPLVSDNARIDSIYTLNPMAAAIWDDALLGLCDDDIVARVVGEYNVDQATARKDTNELLAQFVAVNALKRVQDRG